MYLNLHYQKYYTHNQLSHFFPLYYIAIQLHKATTVPTNKSINIATVTNIIIKKHCDRNGSGNDISCFVWRYRSRPASQCLLDKIVTSSVYKYASPLLLNVNRNARATTLAHSRTHSTLCNLYVCDVHSKC